MATQQSTIDYIIDQVASAGTITSRKMFGEYALYCDGKVVALVCDDTLFVKITPAGRDFVGSHYKEGFAYEGARPSMEITEEQIEDRQWLSELIRITAENVPAPKAKVKVKRKTKTKTTIKNAPKKA